jgi:CheY-like chemotaxis protein
MLARKILLVDDSKSARFALKKLLQKHDFKVEMVDSGEAALDFLKTDRPDAIFMDHLMKGMDGLDATTRIKQDPSTADIPVVMCTSNDGEEYMQQARSHGALGTLLKPPSSSRLNEILAAVNEAILESHGAAEGAGEKPLPPAMTAEEQVHETPVAERQIPEGLDVNAAWDQLRPRIAALVSNELQQFEAALNENMKQQREKFQALLLSARQQQESVAADAREGMEQARSEVEQGSAEAERLIVERLEEQNRHFWRQLNELKEKLGAEILSSEKVSEEVGRIAREMAQSVAAETAAEVAYKIAPVSAEESLSPLVEETLGCIQVKLEQLQQETSKRAGLYAAAAAFTGIVAAVVVYLL